VQAGGAMSADAADLERALAEAAQALEQDLVDVFGFEDVDARVEADDSPRLVVDGAKGRFEVTWPPEESLTEAEGRLGAHARIALELLLASQTPNQFFEDYRPQTETRRRVFFDALKAYVEDSLGENPYYAPLTVVERGPTILVYGDDEYALVAEDGNHKGHGILHWKVRRLVAFAMTDADDEVLEA
jgi:hypothetical protein